MPKRLELARELVREPCGEDWSAMRPAGAEVRHCAKCDRHVHEVGTLEAPEIARLLAESGGTACIRTDLTRRALITLGIAVALVAGTADAAPSQKKPPKRPPAPPRPRPKLMGCVCVPGDPLCSCL